MSRIIKFGLESVKYLSLALCLTFVVNAQENQALDTMPEVVSPSVPRYPSIARSAKSSGTVNIDIMVAEDGRVTSAKAIDGHPLLRSIAEVSAREWRFAPAKNSSGRRGARLIFTFRLLPSGTSEGGLRPIFLTPYHVEIRQTPNEGISDPAPVLTSIRKKKSASWKPKRKSRRQNE